MSDNVRYLPGAEPDEALASKAENNQDIIDMLEGLMVAAKAGQIDALACAYVMGGHPGNIWARCEGYTYTLTASITLLQHEYLRGYERIDDDD